MADALPTTPELDQELSRLEAEVKRLEAEYNMFFAGRRPRLPWETRSRVEAQMKRFDRLQVTNTAQRFRFATLQSRYSSFCELWERSLRAREEGRGRDRRQAARGAPPAREHVPPQPSAVRDETITLRDAAAQPEHLTALFERFTVARAAAGETALPYERFAQAVSAQVRKLGAGGAKEVSFSVDVRNGKATLTAKVGGEANE